MKEEKLSEIKKELQLTKEKVVALNNENHAHEVFKDTLITILGTIEVTSDDFYSRNYSSNKTTQTKGEKIIDAIVKLQREHAREDEGTALQAETISILTDALHAAMNDHKRIVDANNETELFKQGFMKVFEPSLRKEIWVKHNR